jgi:hypothetical protein
VYVPCGDNLPAKLILTRTSPFISCFVVVKSSSALIFLFSCEQLLPLGMLAALAVIEGSYLSLLRQENPISTMSHKLLNYRGPYLSPVLIHQGLAIRSQITPHGLHWHISSEIEWSSSLHCLKKRSSVALDNVHGNVTEKYVSLTQFEQGIEHSSLESWIGVHIFGYGIDEDPNRFVTDKIYPNGELWSLPDIKLKWSTASKSEWVQHKFHESAFSMAENVIMSTAVVAALAAMAAVLSDGDRYPHSWLVVQTLFAVSALVFAIKVKYCIFASQCSH